jgi:hypothetical protein
MPLKNAVVDCLESVHAWKTDRKYTEMTLNKEKEIYILFYY